MTIEELYDTGDQVNVLIANHLIAGLFGLKKNNKDELQSRRKS